MIPNYILVAYEFDNNWPFAADHMHELWETQGPTRFIRLPKGEKRTVLEILEGDAAHVRRIVLLGVYITLEQIEQLPALEELAHNKAHIAAELKAAEPRVSIHCHPSESFWSQSVAEFGLALTLCGLRRIPQLHHDILTSLDSWNYDQDPENIQPRQRGIQFGDDIRFTNGTVRGKRIRIVGAGNIAALYANFVSTLGASVRAYDPFASEPCFTLAGTEQEHFLERLPLDADIFVPMVPLTDATEGLITAEIIDALPKGCLVVLVTRANICDMEAIRRRVLADEISLAADVFDIEPVPLDDPLLGRHNVVHTPHNAGRTEYSNLRYVDKIAEQFRPIQG
ncbi:hypothetical protein MLD52_00965 [Puniceicoccaceae bacterium K14]|nr:hypothetical protein [Puniceicoccaceae bacterium K14]